MLLTSLQTKAQNETASFTSDINGNSVHFTNTSNTNVNDTSLRRCLWQFGDGSSVLTHYDADPSHTYQQPGTYEACLRLFRRVVPTTATGDTLMLVSYSCKAVVITAPDSCRANFETGPVTSTPLGRVFSAIPWHNNQKKPESICWNFGDGHDTCINYNPGEPPPPNGYSVHHLYNQPGTYNVCLKIQYQGGCGSYYCRTVQTGEPDSCTANFESPAASPTALGKYFIAQPWHNHNKKPVRICWTFGDGTNSCIQYATTFTGTYAVYHLYTQRGTYNVCVNILYDGGCESQSCHTIQAGGPDSCTANFERLPVTTSNNPLQAVFRALPSDNHNNNPVQICWTFGDNRDTCIQYASTSTGPYTVSHNYTNAGSYEVCVKILYGSGCEASKCNVIEIGRPDSCRADFEQIPVTSSSNALNVYYKALPWNNNNKKPARICWTFGDGTDTCITYSNTSNAVYAVAHAYHSPGLYEVCVSILYDGGCEAKNCRSIQIGEPDSCSADFERSALQDTDPLTIGLKAIPLNSHNRKPALVCWIFGDAADTCIKYTEDYNGIYAVGHRYHQPGQYEVCVSILYYGGCEAKKCKLVIIPPVQHDTCSIRLVEITPSINSLVREFIVYPSSIPNRSPESICWYFGDGTDTCMIIDPQHPLPDFIVRHVYPGPGVYRACVKVVFHEGCIAYNCREVVIRSVSNICGGYMIDSLAGPHSFKFKGVSIHGPNDVAVSYRWTFGDGSSADGQEVTHGYSLGGDHEVCLYIKTQSGCETRICKTVRVPGNNQSALQLSPNPVISELHIQFFSTNTEQVNIEIFNVAGLPVRSYIRNVTAGNNTWSIDLGTLMPGIYSLIVQSPNQLASAIFLKQ